MKDLLFAGISKRIASFKKHDIIVSQPFKNKDGAVHINISFNEAALYRESLQPHDYPKGVSDIVLHFVRGWNAKDYAYGNWARPKGNYEQVRSRRYKPADDFLSEAVLEFNKMADGAALAELKKPYRG
jgi:hypothetical protein